MEMLTRREFGKLALAGVPAAAILHGREPFLSAFAQAKPNSLIDGVQIGTITYSYRSMPDQSAEATLKYIVESGHQRGRADGRPGQRLGAQEGQLPAEQCRRRRAGGGGGGGAGGGRGGRWRRRPRPRRRSIRRRSRPSWNGVTCAPGREGDAPRGGGAGLPAPGGAGAPRRQRARARGWGGGGRGRGEQTPEQHCRGGREKRKWRLALPMSIFKDLRKMYNDAGVSIYAVKDVRQGS